METCGPRLKKPGMAHAPEEISIPIGEGRDAPRTWPGKGGDEAIAEVTSAGSMFGLFSRSAAEKPENKLFGWRPVPGESPYESITYTEGLGKVIRLANVLISDYGVKKGDRIGVYGKNCAAWASAQYAINAAGGILVPIYDTLGADIVEYVSNHAEVETIFVAVENWDKFQAARSKCKALKNVIRFDIGAVDSLSEGDDTIGACIAKGSEDTALLPKMGNDDIYVIMYTSGTTGNPKGVVLTNGNVLSSVGSAYKFFDSYDLTFKDEDCFLSFLPLSHIYAQQSEALFIGKAGYIGYYSGNIKLLASDLAALKPTVFCGVPRVYARFQQRIGDNVKNSSGLKKKLFKWAYDAQLKAVQNPGKPRNPFWDYLVISKVKAKVLPKARLCVTGSAPMSAQTNDFLSITMNCPVLQGYGLTETVGGMNCTAPGSISGTCGGPIPGAYVKLHDLPEMGYLSSNNPPQGEVCIKGSIVFKEYYKNPEATKAAFDEDGYFHTGDVGQWNPDGTLQIIDRAKNLFKLSQGEYVSPETLEQEYAKAPLVLQIYVFGDSLQSTLLAVVVPDAEIALPWGKERGLESLEDIASSAAYKEEVLKQLLDEHKKAQFKGYERITDILVEYSDLNELGQGFHVDNNLLTPTFKLKRPQLRKKYKDALDALYAAKQA